MLDHEIESNTITEYYQSMFISFIRSITSLFLRQVIPSILY